MTSPANGGSRPALIARFPVAAAVAIFHVLWGHALPSWFLHPAEFDAIVAMGTPQLVIFLAAMVLVVGILAPAVEELYFRGYLMPALGRFGAWAPVISVGLFTLSHFESHWEGPVRFAVVLPMAWAVWKLRSVRLGIIVHVALNTLSAVVLALAVLGAR
jgi:uncharacterized protein